MRENSDADQIFGSSMPWPSTTTGGQNLYNNSFAFIILDRRTFVNTRMSTKNASFCMQRGGGGGNPFSREYVYTET